MMLLTKIHASTNFSLPCRNKPIACRKEGMTTSSSSTTRRIILSTLLLSALLVVRTECFVFTSNSRTSTSLRFATSHITTSSFPRLEQITRSIPCSETTATRTILRAAEVASEPLVTGWSRWDNALRNLAQTVHETAAVSSSSQTTPTTPTAAQVLQQQPSISSSQSVASFRNAAIKLVKRYWWSLPLLLCLVPLYTSIVYQSPPATPQWWKLTNLDYLWHHSSSSHTNPSTTSSLLTLFLCTNVSYFLGGLYLLRQYPLLRQRRRGTSSSSSSQSTLVSSSSRASLLLVPVTRLVSHPFNNVYRPSRATWLALWLLLAGSISTLFHAVQAFGEYAIAEGWCYLDHGVAIAATLYFVQYCQTPHKPTLCLGLMGVAALALPLPGYLGWHSAWHFMSAGAAVLWATQPKAKRRAQLESAFFLVRQQQEPTPPTTA